MFPIVLFWNYTFTFHLWVGCKKDSPTLMPIWPDFVFLVLFSRNVNMFGERIPSCSSWGYWNWLMLTKRLLNQLLSANTIHSILGSFYFGNFLPSNSLGQNLRYLANNIDMTLKEQTMFHSKIMHCSCVPIFIWV